MWHGKYLFHRWHSKALSETYLCGDCPFSPGPGWHYLPHKHTWEVTHGLDSHAQGERVAMKQFQWPVVQGDEMCLNITVHFWSNVRAEGLVCRRRKRHCRETISEILLFYTNRNAQNWETVCCKCFCLIQTVEKKNIFSFTSSELVMYPYLWPWPSTLLCVQCSM